MGQATAELYPAKISKGQRLVSGFRLLNRFLHDFAGARQFAVRQPQLPIRRKFCRGYLSYQARRPH
jgi:hypothetical protein